MLQILINYDSRWCNSFLDGDNNSPLPKNGRGYVASLKNLNDRQKGEANFIRREITQDTVMGVLNRLIGDQRKLYQSRESSDYYFAGIEDQGLVSFLDEIATSNEEVVHLRNFSKSTDQNAFSGMIDTTHPAFVSDFSLTLWKVLFLDLEALCDFVISDTKLSPLDEVDPMMVAGQYTDVISKMKGIKIENPKINFVDKVLAAEKCLSDYFGVNYRNAAGTDVNVYSLYCSALYLQIDRLGKIYDVTPMLTKSGGISGFSKRGFTYKDFMKAFTTGNGKIVFGNPYYRETYVKGEGKVREMLTKASGTLSITIDCDEDKSFEIRDLIHSAGVMSFPLGKKGLAYVSKMKVVEK